MPRVCCDPKINGGVPCVAGTRVSIFVLNHMYHECGCDLDRLKDCYPFLSKEDIKFAIRLAEQLGNPPDVNKLVRWNEGWD